MHREVYPTMITPYTADGKVDYETAKKYVKWYAQKGCTGIFSLCQSSEISYLTLEERIQLNTVVYETAQKIKKDINQPLTIVTSGHIEGTIQEQAYELNKIIEMGTDALVLITNRLDPNQEGDDVWIRNAEKLLSSLPEDIPLGLYECPAPYKKLLTPTMLDWCIQTDCFVFVKDTSCDINIIHQRLQQLKNSKIKIYNANAQTLLASLQAGAAGYSGVMANFHPQLYVYLCEHFETEPEKAELLQAFLCTTSGFAENSTPYPLSAKYHMRFEGIPTVNYARNRNSEELTDYMKDCTKQMHTLCEYFYKQL